MRALLLSSAALFVFGCQGTPCVAYLDAQDACYAERGEKNLLAESNAYCRDFTEASDSYFTCLTAAYKDADCSTAAGFEDAISTATECSQE